MLFRAGCAPIKSFHHRSCYAQARYFGRWVFGLRRSALRVGRSFFSESDLLLLFVIPSSFELRHPIRGAPTPGLNRDIIPGSLLMLMLVLLRVSIDWFLDNISGCWQRLTKRSNWRSPMCSSSTLSVTRSS